jgi:hypothetical protein
MTSERLTGPVLFCFDGSDGSRGALKAAGDLIERPVGAVVITVWETIATRLALSGAFAVGSATGGADLSPLRDQSPKKGHCGRPSTGTTPHR